MQSGLQQFSGGRIPFTWTVIGANILTFFLLNGAPGLKLSLWLMFMTDSWWTRPWTLVTWPLLGASEPLSLLFSVGWMYLFGGSMERAWGTSLYMRFFAVCALISALAVWVGGILLGVPLLGALAGIWAAVGPTMVAWALVNQHEQISFFFIPMPAWAVGILGVVLTWFYGGGALLGLFAALSCGAAYWYAVKGRYLRSGGKAKSSAISNTRFVDFDREAKGEAQPSSNPFTRAAEEKKRRERDKKLEEMFRRSGYDDDGNRS